MRNLRWHEDALAHKDGAAKTGNPRLVYDVVIAKVLAVDAVGRIDVGHIAAEDGIQRSRRVLVAFKLSRHGIYHIRPRQKSFTKVVDPETQN